MNKKTEKILIDIGLYILIIFGGVSVDFGSVLFGVLLIGICSYYVGRKHQREYALKQEEVKEK